MPRPNAFDDFPENFLLSERINSELPEQEWIFDGLWPAKTIGLFTGDGGVGKTHFTLQLLKLIAEGGEIAGTRFRCSTPRDVVYVSQEDECDFLLGEIRSQFPHLRDQPDVSSRIRFISTAIQGSNLTIDCLDSRIGEYLPEGCVFVLDSLSTFLTGPENDNTRLQAELTTLRSVMKSRGATAFLVHHRPKANTANGYRYQASSRGGTALPNNCRFHIMIERANGGVKLSFEKVSRGAIPDDIPMQFDEEGGLLVPAELDRYIAIFQPGEELSTREIMIRLGKDPDDGTERYRVLDHLRRRSRRGGKLTKTRNGARNQDSLWKRIGEPA